MQRVAQARVTSAGAVCGEIGLGLLVYLGCEQGDGTEQALRLAGRLVRLRVFADAAGKTNLALAEVGGSVLLVSQFTLAADTRKGNRPSFTRALAPAPARLLVEQFAGALRAAGAPVQQGVFGAEMRVESVNLGPATYLLEETSKA